MDAKMKVERAAAGAAIDGVLKYVNHGDDRTKALLNLTDFVQKFTGNMFAEKTFDNIRTMLKKEGMDAVALTEEANRFYAAGFPSAADWMSWIRR